MELVSICHQCSKTIKQEYPFCPWCGSEQAKIPDWEGALKDSCRKIDFAMRRRQGSLRLDKVKQSLIELENEVEMLLQKEKE